MFLLVVLAGSALGALEALVASLPPWRCGWLFGRRVRRLVRCAGLLLGMWANIRMHPWQVPVFGAVALLSAVVRYHAVLTAWAGGLTALLGPVGCLLLAWLWLLVACAAGPVLSAGLVRYSGVWEAQR